MKSQLKISGKKHELPELTRDQTAVWSFERRPGGWIIAIETKNGVEKRSRFSYERAQNLFWSVMNGHHLFGEKMVEGRAGQSSASASDLTAQFPGKVRKIMVTEGQVVDANTPLLMVEAMKMEFAIKAPFKGTVKKILVAESAQLTPGQLLLDFEESK